MQNPLLSPKELTSVSSTHRFPNPEPSEEPFMNSHKHQDPTQDLRQSTELNSSSLQVSTQQSLNFKKSFCLSSPKRSIPATPLLLANKLKEIQSMSLKLRENLRDLEEESRLKSEDPEKLLNSPNTQELFELYKGEKDAGTDLNSDQLQIEIPQLRWCAYCKAEKTTEIEFINTSKTFWSSVGIFFAGGVLGCFMLPYMTNYCKGAKIICHTCRRPLS